MSTIFSKAFAYELLDRNIMTVRYKLPKRTELTRKVSEEVYCKDEAEDILWAIKGELFEGAYILSMFGGCRRAEAVGCKVADLEWIDTDSGVYAVYHIKRGVQLVNGQLITVPPKTKGSERPAIVVPPYSERLKELAESAEGEWLTGNGLGAPMNPNTMTVIWRRWFTEHPYKGIPWKNLRNSYVTIMHEQGYDLSLIAKLVGHASEAMTYRKYDRPDAESLVRALSR